MNNKKVTITGTMVVKFLTILGLISSIYLLVTGWSKGIDTDYIFTILLSMSCIWGVIFTFSQNDIK